MSPHIKDRIATLLPEDAAESPVRKFLKQFEYSDLEDMPKNSSKVNPNSPSKSDSSAADMDKNKKEMDDFRKEIKEVIEASNTEIKTANANSVDQIKKDQQEFMNSIKEVIGKAQAGVDSKINTLSDKMDVQTTEYTALKEDLRALQHKVSDMEKREAEVKLKEDRKGL